MNQEKFSPTKLENIKVSEYYKKDISFSGKTPVCNAIIEEGLPEGIELNFKAHKHLYLEGTPKKAGKYEFTLSVACFGTNVNGDSGVKAYTLIVEE
jgi:hypothetical protein